MPKLSLWTFLLSVEAFSVFEVSVCVCCPQPRPSGYVSPCHCVGAYISEAPCDTYMKYSLHFHLQDEYCVDLLKNEVIYSFRVLYYFAIIYRSEKVAFRSVASL